MATKDTIASTKERLIRKIRSTRNLQLLEYLDGLMDTGHSSWWETLPSGLRASVKKGIEEADRNEFVPADEVKRVRAQWRSK